MTTKTKPYRARNYKDVESFIYNREEFNHGSCSARWYERFEDVDTGLMQFSDACLLDAAFERSNSGVFVVRSYETPIAWVVPGEDAVIPDVKYSSTTSRQQNICRRYL